METDVN